MVAVKEGVAIMMREMTVMEIVVVVIKIQAIIEVMQIKL